MDSRPYRKVAETLHSAADCDYSRTGLFATKCYKEYIGSTWIQNQCNRPKERPFALCLEGLLARGLLEVFEDDSKRSCSCSCSRRTTARTMAGA